MAGKKQNTGFLKHWIVKNLLIAFGIVVFLIVGAMIFLNVVTKHNQVLSVPDFTNMTVAEASELALSEGMRVEVADSIFVKRMKRGAVYTQNPSAGSKVKKGRRISVTINAVTAKKVGAPNLVGYSLRQAMAELQSRGLVLGKLIYVQDMATNNVLKQLLANKELEPGTLIESESVIDLVVGLNSSDNVTYIPEIRGLRYVRAVDVIHENSLNVRRLRFDNTVKTYDDSLAAVVYKQSPEASDMPARHGDDVSLYLTLDEKKVPSLELVEEK